VAGPAIAKRARAKIEAQPSAGTALLQLAGGNLDLLTSENVGKAYANGDPLAREVLLDTVELLAIWLGNMMIYSSQTSLLWVVVPPPCCNHFMAKFANGFRVGASTRVVRKFP